MFAEWAVAAWMSGWINGGAEAAAVLFLIIRALCVSESRGLLGDHSQSNRIRPDRNAAWMLLMQWLRKRKTFLSSTLTYFILIERHWTQCESKSLKLWIFALDRGSLNATTVIVTLNCLVHLRFQADIVSWLEKCSLNCFYCLWARQRDWTKCVIN